jgi:acyl dehydratase
MVMWPFLSTDPAVEHAGIAPELVGSGSGVALRTWESRDAVAYAAGIGASPREGMPPTLVTLVCQFDVEFPAGLGPWSFERVLHAEQSHHLYSPLPPRGLLSVRTYVSDVHDTPSGAVVGISAEAVSASDGRLVARTRMGLFVRGERTGVPAPPRPDRDLPEPGVDGTVTQETRPDQAQLYARGGDDNPLHTDEAAAARAGLERPILHGLCTYGFAGRALVSLLCPGEPHRLTAMSARFSAPVVPGDTLHTDITRTAGGAVFRTRTGDGTVVLDGGTARLD